MKLNGSKIEQFFFQEFVPEIESKFNIVKAKTHRGIAGLSSGGYGATTYGLKYHHLFSFAYSMSGVVFLDERFQNIFEIKSWSWCVKFGAEGKLTEFFETLIEFFRSPFAYGL